MASKNNIKGIHCLDDIVKEFNLWQNYLHGTEQDKVVLADKVEQAEKLLGLRNEQNSQLCSDVQQLKEHIQSLIDTLVKRCDLEDENRQLKETVSKLDKDLTEKEIYVEAKIQEFTKQLLQQQNTFDNNLKENERKLKLQFEREISALIEVINSKQVKIEELTKELTQKEKDKQTEMIQMRIEYDSKIMKMQKQNSKTQQFASSAVNHDIYRKKLQHTKSEYDKEIGTLKKTINDLKQRLMEFEDRPHTSYSGVKKKRY